MARHGLKIVTDLRAGRMEKMYVAQISKIESELEVVLSPKYKMSFVEIMEVNSYDSLAYMVEE